MLDTDEMLKLSSIAYKNKLILKNIEKYLDSDYFKNKNKEEIKKDIKMLIGGNYERIIKKLKMEN